MNGYWNCFIARIGPHHPIGTIEVGTTRTRQAAARPKVTQAFRLGALPMMSGVTLR